MNKILYIPLVVMLGAQVNAQSTLIGNWDTGEQGTIIKVSEKEGEFGGEILTSDNPKVQTGIKMLRELEYDKNSWTGELYSIKGDTWYDAEFRPTEEKLFIKITLGFFQRDLTWEKIEI